MSGGRFEYVQFRFGEIVETIRSTIANNDSTTGGGTPYRACTGSTGDTA